MGAGRRGRAAILCIFALVCSSLFAAPAFSQDPSAEVSGPVFVLRPSERLRELAARSIPSLRRRGLESSLGEPCPLDTAEAALRGEIAIVPTEAGHVRILLIDRDGRLYETELALEGESDTDVRSLTLAILTLNDSRADARPVAQAQPTTSSEDESYSYIEPTNGLLGAQPTPTPGVRALFAARVLVGFSTARDTVLVGPGLGFGLCVGTECIVLEADLPLGPERRIALDDAIVQYLPISFAMRVLLRPLRSGPFFGGLSAGILSRLGQAWVEGEATSRTSSNFGLRGTLEVGWELAPSFEAVVELGADGLVGGARFTRSVSGVTQTVLLEDFATLWGVVSLRFRP